VPGFYPKFYGKPLSQSVATAKLVVSSWAWRLSSWCVVTDRWIIRRILDIHSHLHVHNVKLLPSNIITAPGTFCVVHLLGLVITSIWKLCSSWWNSDDVAKLETCTELNRESGIFSHCRFHLCSRWSTLRSTLQTLTYNTTSCEILKQLRAEKCMNTVEKWLIGFPKVKWLHYTGEVDRCTSYRCQIFNI